MKALLVLLCSLTSSVAWAEEPPPLPEGGLNFFLEGACEDHESGQRGYCYMGKSHDGTTYMTFWQQGEMMFIREVLPDQDPSYKTIWVSAHFNSI